jgi:molybdopterin synthase catalytic subunit
VQVIVQDAPFDPGLVLSGFAATGAGAVVTFTGLVRGDGAMTGMEIEHYPGMTERAITAMVDQAMTRWSLTDTLVIHRYGRLAVGEPIMMVVTASAHRVAAFEAAEFLMDYLKSRAPFWKKELGPDGAAWVAAKDVDEVALKRW